MKTIKIFIAAVSVSLISTVCSFSQPQFDITQYKVFLEQHEDMTTSQLLEMHPAGVFRDLVQTLSEDPLYLDSIEIKFNLTDYEKSLIQKYGFMVTERLRRDSFGQQLWDIYDADLPVFISTDAILHAFHMSYDRILKDVEVEVLIPRLIELLNQLHGKMPDLESNYSTNNKMEQMLKDVDVYLTVPGKLLGQNASPYYPENNAVIDTILNLIEAEQVATYPFFSEHCKLIDFSQFRPRGHYVDSHRPELAQYFRAMMWLGRIELYLLAPQSFPYGCPPQSSEDIQRQTIDAVLLSELVDLANAYQIYEEIEDIITFFVGDQDNVTLPNLKSVLSSVKVTIASQLLDTLALQTFQDTLQTKSFASQQILSQILIHDPFSPESIVPASSFLLFGQRFVIDSYVTGSVVFDKIKYNDQFIHRMLPSTLDILFALGNDASAQLLVPELDQYHYATNLAALRYLVDSYDEQFWSTTLYNMWLNSIRTLNPPFNRENLPSFMQTAAWWQQKLNTQLSTWTELRHDNLLYAKQSYTGGEVCSFPHSYVEPIPQFFHCLHLLAETAMKKFQDISYTNDWMKYAIARYFETLSGVADTLGTIAEKELNGIAFTGEEHSFLRKMLKKMSGSGPPFDGWYTNLFYKDFSLNDGFLKKDFLVADYHTQPTDEFGNFVGKVAHAGTGPIDLAVVVAELPGFQNVAFVGPVMSSHEYTTTNFLRLTDDEWEESYLQLALRPNLVNLYLANENGESRGDGPSLLTNTTGVDDNDRDAPVPVTHIIAQNYPNPFNTSTIIGFSVPHDMTNSLTELTIYNIQGQVVKRLLKETLSSGNYLTRWNGTDDLDQSLSSGIYFYEVKVESQRCIGKMSLLK